MTGFFKEIFSSFYDSSVYGEIARKKKGIGASFILALTIGIMLITAVLLGGGYAGLRKVIGNTPAVVADLPAMTLKDGKLSIDKPVPYEIKLGVDPDMLRIVIDTNYKISDLGALQTKMKQEKIAALVTADAVVTPGQNGELKVTSLSDAKASVINHDDWVKLGQFVTDWGVTVIVLSFLIFGFIGVFLFNLVATFCTAIVVAIVGTMAGASLEFDASMRVAALARIPVTVMSSALSSLGLAVYSSAIGWLLWAGYIIFAVLACKRAPLSTK